tara:strand:+ start:27081 stop:28673 length:1593 start_codon:yes stop_codon:yes gene_type:complete
MLELLTSENVLSFFLEYGTLGLLAFVVLVALVIFGRNAGRNRTSSKTCNLTAGEDALVQKFGDVSKSEIGANKSKVAGRDLHEAPHTLHQTNIFVSGQLNYELATTILGKTPGLSESDLVHIFSQLEGSKLPPLQEFERAEVIAQNVAALRLGWGPVHHEFAQPMNIVETKFQTGHQHLENGEFIQAHSDFEYVLDHCDSLESGKVGDVINKYLHSGLICYGVNNNKTNISNIVNRITSSELRLDVTNISALSDVMQELSTRDTDATGLHSVVSILENFRNKTEFTPEVENSLGLAYRRLGERGDEAKLELAIESFSNALQKEKEATFLRADILNNKAIAYVRRFEATHRTENLELAKSCLEEGIRISERIDDYRSFMLCPKLHNNFGNYYKQRNIAEPSQELLALALAEYGRTDEWWTEKTAPYEWAMVQKNIAEVILPVAEKDQDVDALQSVIAHCLNAVRYRDIENSPFQWLKTMRIALQAQLALLGLGEPINSKLSKLIDSTVDTDVASNDAGFRDLVDRMRATKH